MRTLEKSPTHTDLCTPIFWHEVIVMMEICGCPGAIARINGGTSVPNLRGWVKFYQDRCGVWVRSEICGLPHDGFFALHIHEGNSCAGQAFADTKGHYNPAGTAHPAHAGDLPPLLSCGGRAEMAVLTDRFQLREIIGRTVVIHSAADDFHSQPAGNAGEKIACGVVRLPNQVRFCD